MATVSEPSGGGVDDKSVEWVYAVSEGIPLRKRKGAAAFMVYGPKGWTDYPTSAGLTDWNFNARRVADEKTAIAGFNPES